MGTIRLGHYDSGKKPNDFKRFLRVYHQNFGAILENRPDFRDDDRTDWRSFTRAPDDGVTELQRFLKDAGFMPRANLDGVFGYVTQAATRLFQEYVRTIEGIEDTIPDGIVGNKTWGHIERWQTAGTVCYWGKEWDQDGPKNTSDEYDQWMALLRTAKTHYQQNPPAILSKVADFGRPSDTLKVDDWSFDPKEIHLIGITRTEDKRGYSSDLNDLFLLLVNGQVFKFWGSTDPSDSTKTRQDKPFLVEGQHKYRFGWHKLSKDSKGRLRVYRAFRPYSNGVLVVRNEVTDTTLDDADITKGLETNSTINIHWSGFGFSNWSAGCQVIAGKSYMDPKGTVMDCSGFAAKKYGELTSSFKKTKGAYNILADLIFCYARPDTDYMYYTLGREASLKLDASLGTNYISEALDRMKNLKN